MRDNYRIRASNSVIVAFFLDSFSFCLKYAHTRNVSLYKHRMRLSAYRSNSKIRPPKEPDPFFAVKPVALLTGLDLLCEFGHDLI